MKKGEKVEEKDILDHCDIQFCKGKHSISSKFRKTAKNIFDLSVYFFLKYKVFFQTNPLVIHVNPGIVASDIADKFLEPLKIWLKPAQPTIQNAKRFSTLLIKGMEHCVTLQTLTDN